MFYLRDFGVRQLQNILIFGAVPFTRDSPLPTVQNTAKQDKLLPKWLRKKEKVVVETVCSVVETKEIGSTLKVGFGTWLV